MNKTFWIIGLIVLSTLALATAYEDKLYYKARCEIIRPATDYREAYSYGYIGVYGRLSNGEQICFLPGIKKVLEHKKTCKMVTEQVCEDIQVCETIYEEVCHEEETCKEECHKEKRWKQTCEWKHGRWHCDYGWVWENVCRQVCNTKTVCEDQPRQECHTEQTCHEEKNRKCK